MLVLLELYCTIPNDTGTVNNDTMLLIPEKDLTFGKQLKRSALRQRWKGNFRKESSVIDVHVSSCGCEYLFPFLFPFKYLLNSITWIRLTDINHWRSTLRFRLYPSALCRCLSLFRFIRGILKVYGVWKDFYVWLTVFVNIYRSWEHIK